MLSESNFLQNTKAIRSALNLKWDDYVESFGMTQAQAQKHLQNPLQFPLKYAMNFCEYFELDLENAFSDQFDAKVFARNYLKEQPILPEKYQVEKNSRVITLINFVAGLNDEGLEWLNELIFRRLQVPKTILLYPELNIPFKLIIDYMDLLEKFLKDFEFMKRCGRKGIINIDKKLKLVESGASLNVDFYDEFFTDKIKQFDKTYDYRLIHHKADELILEGALREEFKDQYKVQSISNKAFLQYKCGITNGLSTLLGHSPGKTTILNANKIKNDLFLIKMPKPLSSSLLYQH